MYSIRRFSKVYQDALDTYRRKEDFEIANIAKENNRRKGQILGAVAGVVGGAYGGKYIKSAMAKYPKAAANIDKLAPGVLESLSKAAVIPTAIAGTHYGGELTGNAAKKMVLQEIEDERSGLKNLKGRRVRLYDYDKVLMS